MFEPIAVVGRGCVLPEALTPDALWNNIMAKRVCLGPVPDGYWRLDHPLAGEPFAEPAGEATGLGGYVRGFDTVWEPDGFFVEPADIGSLDPLVHWTLHCGREALRETGLAGPLPRTGLVLGVLGYPSPGMSRFAERTWTRARPEHLRRAAADSGDHDPRNRFSGGLTAHLTAKALGLTAGSMGLDAACASSLYAIKIAVDRLHDGVADVMLAAAVNRADDLFLHAAFDALGALSRTGRSRPFARTADGLVPAEGAACVALMRLADAVRAGTPIFAVIRGLGLSNGGRGEGLLAPSPEGQERAILGAYRAAGLDPGSVSLLECHATGTSLGDAVEARTTAKVFAGARDLPVGSAKSNLGHLVTVAGLAGLLKLIGAMHAGVRPATLGADDPAEALTGTTLRPLAEHEPWEGVRRAGLSTFGFGGNNAHLVLDALPPAAETYPGPYPAGSERSADTSDPGRSADGSLDSSRNGFVDDEVAIVAIGARVGTGASVRDFAEDLFGGRAPSTRRKTVATPLPGLRFPPSDLEHTLAQQLLVLDAAREALAGQDLPRERTMVLVGMGCDPEVVRNAARWRVPSWLAEGGAPDEVADDPAARDVFAPPFTSAGVVGTMPNIVTNRLNSQFDLAGPSFSVFAEEASGPAALELGCRALRAGEADAVVVGAVDLSCEPVHEASLRALGCGRRPGDAAVVLLLRRRADAERDGAAVIALVGEADILGSGPGLGVGPDASGGQVPGFDPVDRFGSAHAAEGLVAVAAAALAVRHRAVPRPGRPADPMLCAPVAEVTVAPMGAPTSKVWVRGVTPAAWSTGGYAVHVYTGRDRQELAEAVRDGHRGGAGPCRLALVERPGDLPAARREAAHRWLIGQGERPAAMAFRDRPADGEVAFVYTNGSACYPQMGRSLMLAFPELVAEIRERCGDLARFAEPVFAGDPADPLRKNLAATLLADLHTRLTRDTLAIRPDAVLGYSSGEASGMVALQVWRDIPALVAELTGAGCFTHGLVGEQRIARRAWRRMGLPDERWVNLLVAAPAERVEAALEGEPAAFLLAVNTPGQCVVGGAAAACDRVVRRISGAVTAIPLGYDIAAHSRVLSEARTELLRIYRHPVHVDPPLRFYTSTTGAPYVPTPESVAEVLTTLTLDRIDFAATVRRAWDDGVRVFVEHGPRNLCSGWISSTLHDRDHLTVALDGTGAGEDSLAALARAIAELAAAGICTDPDPVLDRLAPVPLPAAERPRSLVTPAHPPLVATALARPPFTGPRPGGATGSPPASAPAARASEPAVLRKTEGRVTALRRALQARDDETRVPARESTGSPNGHHPVPGRAAPALTLDRTQLESLAAGRVAAVLGDRFAAVEKRARHTRMPEPPMLLADRVLDIGGEPCSLGKGTIRTETDIGRDAWYVDGCGRMPAGLVVEAGQADLLLLTWLGADLHVDESRVYRLLGMDVTFHGSPPAVGATARYDIAVDGHGQHGGVYLFFFRSRCAAGGKPRLTVENGQAGYFTDEELAASKGVIWDPGGEKPPNGRWSPPAATTKTSFGFADVRAFAEGRPDVCFGRGWEITRAHVRTPRTGDGRLQLLHRVPVFDPSGGPWKRGYLRAEYTISPQEWFFPGHFTGDPCMPGTLMFEACLQAMAFYLAAYGYTLDRDGWRFEPVPDETFRLLCRGQATPRSRLLTYELFVSEIVDGPRPALFADALCTVDGVKAFHARRLGLRLSPDWPLAHWRGLARPATQPTGEPVPAEGLGGLLGEQDERPATVNGSRFGYPDLLAAAWGRPARRDGPPTIRLPGPPYLFVSRIRDVSAASGGAGSNVVAEYDLPDRAWFREESCSGVAPLGVLTELASQPCSWLIGHLGLAREAGPGARLRNLGGTLTVHRELRPSDGVVRTTAHLTGVTEREGTTVCTFAVACHLGDAPFLTLETAVGLLPAGATAWPSATPAPVPEEAPPDPGGTVLDLRTRPRHLFGGRLRLPGPMLLMIDRVTGFRPDGGAAGLGRLHAEKDLDPGDWWFKAHVFQDPVLPGSLALEAVSQLLQLYLLEGAEAGHGTRFRTPAAGRELTWTHHGEVLPASGRVVLDLEVTGTGSDATGRFATADARLYAGRGCVCQVRGMTLSVVSPRKTRRDQNRRKDEESL
ncbi:beta-ketoacyl synthase N-terminal-like domain-containing protein [Amycolatopsis sp. NPDC051045]|uniref:beta-ketoacyl synthase N-terminal-like domain-containing protein n=1 Tax=Amycolatopsis sp. NPDC051045 TaxID=3156922 RepID=UPI0034199ED2